MALQMNYYNAEYDIMVYNAYWRINPKNGLIGGKDEMNYVIEVFKNAEMSHKDNSQPLNRLTFMFIPDVSENADNFIAQAYNHAKTLPTFQNSIDV